MAILKELYIDGFRSIKNLVIHGLTTINLITGDNNSGKTSLLEAIKTDSIQKGISVPIVHVNPYQSRTDNLIDNILKNDIYKEKCLSVLKSLNPEACDISYPDYACGDQQFLKLAGAIAEAENGLLLIDEIETGLHPKHFDDVFQFVVQACRDYHVQAFITTYNLDAIDGFLNDSSGYNDIALITLKKENGTTYARVLSGEQVAKNREDFEFDATL